MTSPTIVDDNHQHRIANKHGVILSRQPVYIWRFVAVAEIHLHTHMYAHIYMYYFKCVYIYICTHIKAYQAVCLCAYMCVGVILTKCDDHIIIPSLHSIGRNTRQTQRIVLPVVLAVLQWNSNSQGLTPKLCGKRILVKTSIFCG